MGSSSVLLSLQLFFFIAVETCVVNARQFEHLSLPEAPIVRGDVIYHFVTLKLASRLLGYFSQCLPVELASSLFHFFLFLLFLIVISLMLRGSHATAVMHLQIVAIVLILQIWLSIFLVLFVGRDAKVNVKQFGHLLLRDTLLAEEPDEDFERNANVAPTCVYVGKHVGKALVFCAFAIAVVCFKLSFLP